MGLTIEDDLAAARERIHRLETIIEGGPLAAAMAVRSVVEARIAELGRQCPFTEIARVKRDARVAELRRFIDGPTIKEHS